MSSHYFWRGWETGTGPAEQSHKTSERGEVLQAPDDTNPKDLLGLKKPPLRLIPPVALLQEAKVFGLGAKKYGAYNWREKKVRASVYIEAAMRHLLALQDGQDNDEESGWPHAAHVRACMGILMDAASLGNMIDDRPTPGKAAEMIKTLTEA